MVENFIGDPEESFFLVAGAEAASRAKSSATWTWQVAQLISPPHSPTMPGTSLLTARFIAEIPAEASNVRVRPSAVSKVTWGISVVPPPHWRGYG